MQIDVIIEWMQLNFCTRIKAGISCRKSSFIMIVIMLDVKHRVHVF